MKTLILACVAAAAFCGTPALAADMAVKAPPPALAPDYSWTGFYLGVNAGGSVGRSRANVSDNNNVVNETTYLSPAGAIGGGQIGYNWQVPSFFNMVFGLEADIQGSGETASSCIGGCALNGAFQVNVAQKIDWFGTVRGRVGLTNGPVLSYLTGGYAYGHVNTSGSTTNNPFTTLTSFSNDATRGGFVVGSGVEASLGGNWTGKIEYLYVDLGKSATAFTSAFGTPTVVTANARDYIFRGGINYRFGGNSTYVAPVANWSGFYVGGNAGSLTARDQSTYTTTSGAVAGGSINEGYSLVPDGFEGGVQAGYNWQSAAWVFGVEADIQGATSKDDQTCTFQCTTPPAFLTIAQTQKVPYFGTVRGRLGYSVGPTLFYATAGYAYGETKTTITIPGAGAFPTSIASLNSSKGGYAVGGGMESPLSLFGLFGPNWTVKVEYLYVDLGKDSVTFFDAPISIANDTFTTHTQENIFRAGINYHFNPVVAKY